jgi:propionate CoA-transferase
MRYSLGRDYVAAYHPKATGSRTLPELLDEYSAAVRSLVDRFYSGVSRYTTSGFLRMKLGEALEKCGVAPHIFESAAEAQSDFHNLEKGAAE